MTMWTSCGKLGIIGATRCRRRRLTRLRVTALPTALDTTKPTRVDSTAGGLLGRSRACTTRVGRPTRTPWRVVARKSADDRSREARGSIACSSGRQLCATLAAASRKDAAAGTGAHAGTETVGAAAAPVAGLESALGHGISPSWSFVVGPRGLSGVGLPQGAGKWSPQGGDWATIRNAAMREQTEHGDSSPTPTNYISVVQPTRRSPVEFPDPAVASGRGALLPFWGVEREHDVVNTTEADGPALGFSTPSSTVDNSVEN